MSYSKNELLIHVEGVSLTYDKPILRDVNFRIHNIKRPDLNQGQVISLIGRSGIGKTQLFKILAGLIQPDTGNVLIGLDQHSVEAGDVGIVSQNYILFNHRTVYENFRIALKHCVDQTDSAKQEELIKGYADKFDLTEHLKKYPMQLSGGQRQRVSIIQQVLT